MPTGTGKTETMIATVAIKQLEQAIQEGYKHIIPNLKIAAVHDKYKSLPITLQFIGRFVRASEGLGTAIVITNIANDDLNEALAELYAQDSDWNSF